MIDLAMISDDPDYHKYDAKLLELVHIYEHRLILMKRTLVYHNQLCLKQIMEYDIKNGSARG